MAYEPRHVMRHPRCDTFFVESEEDGIFVQHAQARERARLLAKETQKSMAATLSKLTSDEYQDEVLAHMQDMELLTLPDVQTIDIQEEIQWFMRNFLIDFLLEAHAAFGLLPETLYLAVNLLDRYCSKRVVYKRHYQLVGCASLLVASKYGDRKDRVPTVRELRAMCCQLYEEEMFIQMECHVLSTLDWRIGHPTVDAFLQMAFAQAAYDAELEHMVWYICEVALYHRDFVSQLPSVLASSALALARYILSRETPDAPEWSLKYDSAVVMELSRKIAAPSEVVYQKYESANFSGASRIVESFLQRQTEIERQRQAEIERQRQVILPAPRFERTPYEYRKLASDSYGIPHTPQKGHFPPGVQYGYLTPPITPEDGSVDQNIHVKDRYAMSNPGPSTPTPTSGNGHLHPHHYCYDYHNLNMPVVYQ